MSLHHLISDASCRLLVDGFTKPHRACVVLQAIPRSNIKNTKVFLLSFFMQFSY